MLLKENGQLNENGGKYAGLYLNQARAAIVKDLAEAGCLRKPKKSAMKSACATDAKPKSKS